MGAVAPSMRAWCALTYPCLPLCCRGPAPIDEEGSILSSASPPTSPTREGHPGGQPDPSLASNPSSPAAATPAHAAAHARFAEPALLVQGPQLQGSLEEDRGPLARGMAAEVGLSGVCSANRLCAGEVCWAYRLPSPIWLLPGLAAFASNGSA